MLRAVVETFEDILATRIALQQRLTMMDKASGGTASQSQGYGLTRQLEMLRGLEHQAELEVKRAWRSHPLAPWAKAIRGLGDPTIARLIAQIGDPGVRPNVAKLWAYCGVGNPALRRRKGMSQASAMRLGNPLAKALLLNPETGLAAQFLRHKTEPYASLYYSTRARYEADRPDWPQIRRDRAARRVAVKRFLADLWEEARAGHKSFDAHAQDARAGHRPAGAQIPRARAGQRRSEAHTTSARAGEAVGA